VLVQDQSVITDCTPYFGP